MCFAGRLPRAKLTVYRFTLVQAFYEKKDVNLKQIAIQGFVSVLVFMTEKKS